MDAQSRKLLIFDLDETLVHSSESALGRSPAFQVGPYHVYKRPHLDALLAVSFQMFRVAVWTASSEDYAVALVPQLLAEHGRLEFLWARNRCVHKYDYERREEYWLKDFKKLQRAGYDLNQILVVDDIARNHERNYGNLIQVKQYWGEDHDDELRLLAVYLPGLATVANVRTVEKRNWRQQVHRQLQDDQQF
ncbi:MAG: HAD family hydrolase [Acidobacteria bacterium]|nr:HAD family hydrolase [Acidobacteriota bacterium]